ncbi:RNA methyltransferase [Deinococcus sp. Arct2-2]|uniref:TrmH family RNA methyltransferase n=1 Tax=Deinococcus sp. Arct2-2 TaxID=2568653 RepID=UPI0010A40A43|nr:RNA methyltransferase [Deinococcus sp. Arct2-2]THF70046.1 RNA methyltransferase [Deinococcus sp. Arct2-2]
MTAPDVITSLQNALVKRLVRLHTRRERELDGVIVIEGARESARALASGVRPSLIVTCPPLYSPEALAVAPLLFDGLSGEQVQLSRPAFEKISGRENPDGLLMLAPTPTPVLPDPPEQATVIVLHGLEKPGNVGAILRSADAAGAHAVLVLGRGADPYGPNVIRASQGSVFRIPTAVVSEEQAWDWLLQHGFTTVACTPDAPQAYWDAPLTGRVALLLGTEHEGLPKEWRTSRTASSISVSIPMHAAAGGADSLNVSTAAALVLFECVRQRRSLSVHSLPSQSTAEVTP